MTPHPHAEIIKAWADGHTIQCRTKGRGDWFDIENHCTPAFFEHADYRIKPLSPIVSQEYHFYLGQSTPSLVVTEEYPPNVRFTFEAGRLIAVEMLGDG